MCSCLRGLIHSGENDREACKIANCNEDVSVPQLRYFAWCGKINRYVAERSARTTEGMTCQLDVTQASCIGCIDSMLEHTDRADGDQNFDHVTQIWRLGQAAIMQCLYNKLMSLVDAHVAYNTIVYLVKDSLDVFVDLSQCNFLGDRRLC